MAPDVEPIGKEEDTGEDPVERPDVHDARHRREEVEHQEELQVLSEDAAVVLQRAGAGPARRGDHDDHTEDRHREGGDHEGRAEDRADADLVSLLVAGQHGDEGKDRLRERRSDRGEDAPDGPFGEAETLADPLHTVREELRAGEDHPEGDRELQPAHASRSPLRRPSPVRARRDAAGHCRSPR